MAESIGLRQFLGQGEADSLADADGIVPNGGTIDIVIGQQIGLEILDPNGEIISSDWHFDGPLIVGGADQSLENGTVADVRSNFDVSRSAVDDPSQILINPFQGGNITATINYTLYTPEEFESTNTLKVTLHVLTPRLFDLQNPSIGEPEVKDVDGKTGLYIKFQLDAGYSCEAGNQLIGGKIGFLVIAEGYRYRGNSGSPTQFSGSDADYLVNNGASIFWASERAARSGSIQMQMYGFLPADSDLDYDWYQVGQSSKYPEYFSVLTAYQAPTLPGGETSKIMVNTGVSWHWKAAMSKSGTKWGIVDGSSERKASGWTKGVKWSTPPWSGDSKTVGVWREYSPNTEPINRT